LQTWTILHLIAIAWIFIFIHKIKKINSQKLFFSYSILSLAGWCFFDFLVANSPNIETANMFYAFSMTMISLAAFFFYLTVCFFTHVKKVDVLAAASPLILNIPRVLYQKITPYQYGYQITYSFLDYLWMALIIFTLTASAVRIILLSSVIQNKVLEKKMKLFAITLLMIPYASVPSTILTNYFGMPDITPIIAALMLGFSYPLFGGE